MNASDKPAAREHVLDSLRGEVKERQRIVKMHPRGSYGDQYRREILRLWRVALHAADAASR